MQLTQRNPLRPQLLSDAIGYLINQLKNKSINTTSWLKTGLTDFDGAFSGLRLGALTTLAGRPSMGKSSLALNIALNAAISQNLTSLYISLDTPTQQLAERMLLQLSDIDINLPSKRELSSDQSRLINKAIQGIKAAPLSLIYLPYSSMTDICQVTKEFSEGRTLSLLIVDSLGNADMRADDCGAAEYAHGIQLLKTLACELNIAILMLSSINRSAEEREDQRPIFSDLPSVEIAKKSDVLLYLYRDEVYNPQGDDYNQSELIVAKDILGRTGTVYLTGQPTAKVP